MKSDLQDVEVTVHHRTEKAILVSLDGDKENAVWVPLSQCEIERKGETRVYILTAPEWLLVDKGLV